jgi:ABC-type glycerol-3-phosphate transport system substrate-binding protein
MAGAAALTACGAVPAPVAQSTEAPVPPAPDVATAAPVVTAAPELDAATAAPQTAAPEVATEAAGSGAAGSGQQYSGQLVISLNGTGEPLERTVALSEAYKKVQPGVELIWEYPGAQAGEYPTWLGTQLAAAPIRPDIVSGNYVPTYRNYVNFDQYKKTTNPYTGNEWDKDLDWDFFVGRNAKGERNMLPTRSVHTMWFYNKALFEKAGVQPPKTWAEFADVCAKLKESGVIPISANFKWQVPQWLAEIYFDQYHVNWIETVRAQPGDWNHDPELDDQFVFDPKDPNIHNKYTYNIQRFFQGIRDGKLRYDTPEMTDLVKNMAQIFPKYATEDFFVISDPYAPFLQQQAAIMVNGTWSLPTLENDMKAMSPERLKELKIEGADIKPFEWATFENPPIEGPLVKGPVRSVESASGEYLSIIEKDQAQAEMALDFLMFWTSKPGYQVWNDASIKSGRHAPGGPLEINGVEDPPELQKRFDSVTFMGNAETNYNNFIGWGGGNLAIDAQNLYKEALEGKMAPEEFGTRLQKLITDNFDTILEAAELTKEDIDNPAKQPGT